MSRREPQTSHRLRATGRGDERSAPPSGSSLIAGVTRRSDPAGVEEGGDGFAVGLALAELHHCTDERAHRLALTGAELVPRVTVFGDRLIHERAQRVGGHRLETL